MVFTAAQLTVFWTSNIAMGLSARTRSQLELEGIETPDDLVEFNEKCLEKIFKNMANPAKVPLTGAANIAAGKLKEVVAYLMSGKSKMRIEGAMKIAKFYKTIGRPLDPDNMSWIVIKNFLKQHNALKDRKSTDDTTIPKITKNFAVHHWLEAFYIFLGRKIGVRQSALTYVVRDQSAVPAIVPPRAFQELHSEEFGSIEGDQANCLSHTHVLFKLDNVEVFDLLETAVCGSDIAPTIAPFRKLRNGKGTLQAIKNQHAGVRVWDDIVKTAKEVMGRSRKWTGLSSFTLAQHCNLHRKAYILLGEAADHVPVQIPDEQTQVTNLMDSLDKVDPTVLAAVSSVRQDEFNKQVNFEAAVTFLVKSCPVAIKQNKKKVSFGASLSTIEVAPGKGTQKSKMGTTGVPLRYHPKAEFIKLTRAQKEEVAAWVKANPKKGEKRKRDDIDGNSGHKPKKWNSIFLAISARRR